MFLKIYIQKIKQQKINLAVLKKKKNENTKKIIILSDSGMEIPLTNTLNKLQRLHCLTI